MVIKGHETGWPPWLSLTHPDLEPYTYEETIECWLVETRSGDTAYSDFWRAPPQGMMFILRGYQEDCEPNWHEVLKPGTVFDLTLPVWHVGECLLHAERMAVALNAPSSKIVFSFTLEGLHDRTLTSWANPERMLLEYRKSHQNSVTSNIVVRAESIRPNLPEFVGNYLTKPLYENSISLLHLLG